jgi:hypothetical protein
LPNCTCPDGFVDDYPNSEQCLECLPKCGGFCTISNDNCIFCAGLNRVPPTCDCEEGFIEDISGETQDCISPGTFPEVDPGEDGEAEAIPYAA